MSKETQWFYGTQAWIQTQKAFMKSKRGLCELCLKDGLITPAKVVHHKVKVTASNMHDPKITLSWDNLQALCRKHHDEMHKTKRKYSRGYFDSFGNLIIKEGES